MPNILSSNGHIRSDYINEIFGFRLDILMTIQAMGCRLERGEPDNKFFSRVGDEPLWKAISILRERGIKVRTVEGCLFADQDPPRFSDPKEAAEARSELIENAAIVRIIDNHVTTLNTTPSLKAFKSAFNSICKALGQQEKTFLASPAAYRSQPHAKVLNRKIALP
jgi:hypothetical protein